MNERVRFEMQTDFDQLRRNFSEVIAKLSNMRRADAWKYVAALERMIVMLKQEAEQSIPNEE